MRRFRQMGPSRWHENERKFIMSAIHQEIVFQAAPQRVYDLLTSSKLFTEVSGAPADIGTEAGAAFTVFGGMITGRQIEVVPGRSLVQAWRAGNWPPGLYSVARFELAADGATTRLTFDHTGFPPEAKEHLETGWQKMYWDKLGAYLAG
jgi:uncharacterized protein YndB with AHSA1/START domain